MRELLREQRRKEEGVPRGGRLLMQYAYDEDEDLYDEDENPYDEGEDPDDEDEDPYDEDEDLYN
jgi:hypothetical protein